MAIINQTLRWLLIFGLFASLVSCAGGPAPKRAPKPVRQSIYYGNKGAELLNKGCYARALDYFQQAHQRYTAADNLEGVAQSLNAIADLYYRSGDPAGALLVYDDAIAVYQDLDDSSGQVQALSNKAATLIVLGRLEEAASVLDRADALDSAGAQAALRLKTRALLNIKHKDFETAKTLLAQAMVSAENSAPAIRSSIYFATGQVALAQSRLGQAREVFIQALEIDREALAYDEIANDLQALGRCAVAEGNQARAVDYFKRSAKIFSLLQNRPKADEVTAQLKQSAAQANMDIQATLHWIKQWLENGKAIDLCD